MNLSSQFIPGTDTSKGKTKGNNQQNMNIKLVISCLCW